LSTNTENGQSTTIVTVNENDALGTINQGSTGATVVVEVNQSSDVVKVSLGGNIIEQLAASESPLEIRTKAGSYTLPSAGIDFDELARELSTQSKDIILNIVITKPDLVQIKAAEEQAEKIGATMVAILLILRYRQQAVINKL